MKNLQENTDKVLTFKFGNMSIHSNVKKANYRRLNPVTLI